MTVRPEASRIPVIIAFTTLYLAWGSTYLAIRVAMETLPPLLMAGARHLTAGTILYAITRTLGAPRPRARHLGPSVLLGALLLFAGNGATVWAERHLASGLAALVVASTPLWIALLGPLFPGGGRPRALVLAGLGLGFGGVALLVRPGGAVHGPSVMILLGGTLCFAAGSLYSRRAELPDTPGIAVGLQLITGGLIFLLTGAGIGETARLDLAAISGRSLAALVFLVVIGSIAGYTAFGWLLRVRPATQVSTYAYVNPAVALFLGWAFAGETLSLSMLPPAALILGSVILVLFKRKESSCDLKPGLCMPANPARASAGR